MICFDIGLKHTGAAWEGGSDHYDCPSRYQTSGPKLREEKRQRRLAWWRTTFRRLIAEHAKDGIIFVEEPIIHKQNPNGAIPTMELHGILKLAAFDERAVVYEKSNQTMKSWAHKLEGIHTTWPMDKKQMLAVANILGCDTDSEDEADAFILWSMVRS